MVSDNLDEDIFGFDSVEVIEKRRRLIRFIIKLYKTGYV